MRKRYVKEFLYKSHLVDKLGTWRTLSNVRDGLIFLFIGHGKDVDKYLHSRVIWLVTSESSIQ